MCCSRQFGRLQRNICRLLHTCQTSIQDEVQFLLAITIASLPSTQKHFHWANTYIHTYIRVRLAYMCKPTLLKEMNEL